MFQCAHNCKHTKSRHSKVKKALCNSKLKGMQSRRKRKVKGDVSRGKRKVKGDAKQKGHKKQKRHVKYRATIITKQIFQVNV